jgi:RecA-family ATPase
MKNQNTPAIFGISPELESYRKEVLSGIEYPMKDNKTVSTATQIIDKCYEAGNCEAIAIDEVNEYLESEDYSAYWERCYIIACSHFKDPGTQNGWDQFISDSYKKQHTAETAVVNFYNHITGDK